MMLRRIFLDLPKFVFFVFELFVLQVSNFAVGPWFVDPPVPVIG